MPELHLVFRSGAQLAVAVDLDTVDVAEDPASQQLTALTWSGPDGPGELRYVDPAEVAAVIVRDEAIA